MTQTKDILNLDDVKILVDAFYDKVRQNELLADIFNTIIQDNWDIHLEKMYRFLETVLLQKHTYVGSPFAPHAHMPIDAKHFDQWKKLFYQTIDENFTGEKANEAKWRADKMAEMFQLKMAHYKNIKIKPLM